MKLHIDKIEEKQNSELIRIKIASPKEILSWSHGEVTKPETVNYRTQRAEKDGLFCERIFGPTKDYQCYCEKYKGIKYEEIVCDRCGTEVTKSSVRRERMGHIRLATPVSHIWFFRGVPSPMGGVLDLRMSQIEGVIYFDDYIITEVNEEAKGKVLEEIEKEYKQGRRMRKAKNELREEVLSIKPLKVLSETEYSNLYLRHDQCFKAGTGAETLRRIFERIDLKKEIDNLKREVAESQPSEKGKILRRLRLFRGMAKAKIRPEWMFLTVLPVLPSGLRPMLVQLDGGGYTTSDVNDLYRRVLNRNNRLKGLIELNAPEAFVRGEKRMLQEAVDSLIDNEMSKTVPHGISIVGEGPLKGLVDALEGKQGRFYQNLLRKGYVDDYKRNYTLKERLILKSLGLDVEIKKKLVSKDFEFGST